LVFDAGCFHRLILLHACPDSGRPDHCLLLDVLHLDLVIIHLGFPVTAIVVLILDIVGIVLFLGLHLGVRVAPLWVCVDRWPQVISVILSKEMLV